MGRLDRYILLTAGVAFVAALSTLTGMVWLTQILRRFDLLTSQGQTILVFFTVTGLALPTLILLTAPISLFLAVTYTLNKLNGDSELIVMSAAGLSQWQLFRPLMLFAFVVTTICAYLSIEGGPSSVRTLRSQLASVNADVISNVAQPGRFTTLERGITFHIRERGAGGALRGIFVNDSRDSKATTTYIADRGQVVASEAGTFLVLEDGTLHRSTEKANNASMVEFKNYAFDMSQFNAGEKAALMRAAERPFYELLWPPKDDPNFKLDNNNIRVEVHKRLSTPLYPLAAFVIPFAFLGAPQTTRQNRNAAIAAAAVFFITLEIAGFGTWGFVQRSQNTWFLPYLMPLAGILTGLLAVAGFIQLRTPAFAQRIAGAVTARLERLQPA